VNPRLPSTAPTASTGSVVAPAFSAEQAEAVAAHARRARHDAQSADRRRGVAVIASVILAWTAAILLTGQGNRVADNGAAALTMVFGSFVAGSTPQGGGAVAFPVFTKLLGVSTEDARTFSLSIQALGMGTATACIALLGRAVDRPALRLTVPSAISGYLAGTLLFTAIAPPTAYLKIVFTLVIVAAGAATVISQRASVVEHLVSAPLDTALTRLGLVTAAVSGGIASSLFGSGADIAVYLALTVALGVRPAIGVATSVITMAAVSVVGLAMSLATGALSPALPEGSTDIFGMWLAAIPIVVIGAPLGSWFASRCSTQMLAGFIGALALTELVSTAVFLTELRTQLSLATFGVIGLLGAATFVRGLLALRDRLAEGRGPTLVSIRRLDIEQGVPA